MKLRPASCALITYHDRVLLVKRKFRPSATKWCFPGGIIEENEKPEVCVIRETLEETGLNIVVKSLFGMYSDIKQDNFRCVYVYKAYDIGGVMKCGNEISKIKIVTVDDIPWNELAFPSTRKTLIDYKEELSGRREFHY